MANKIMNTKKAFKISVIVYAAIFLIGLIFTLFAGVKLDINFSGGTFISYSYEGKIAEKDFKAAVDKVLDRDYTLSQNTSIAGDTTTYSLSLAGKEALSAELQEKLNEELTTTFKDNKVALFDSNSVSPSIAGVFLLKCLAAVLLAAAIVVLYVGIRFRHIGGVSAALTALCALVLDLLVSFFACVIFRLPIDSYYVAVVLTILGYSLNDTIVIYDKVRENKKYYPELSVAENMDRSISRIMVRNIVTTVTTVCAVVTIIVVSEVCGLTTLRPFAIPMAFGLVSGCVSSLFVAGPLWVMYREKKDAKPKSNKKKNRK